MASPEQLALLEAGVEGWNEWRGKELEKDIDLSEADWISRNVVKDFLP
jgi:hypothetical protein